MKRTTILVVVCALATVASAGYENNTWVVSSRGDSFFNTHLYMLDRTDMSMVAWGKLLGGLATTRVTGFEDTGPYWYAANNVGAFEKLQPGPQGSDIATLGSWTWGQGVLSNTQATNIADLTYVNGTLYYLAYKSGLVYETGSISLDAQGNPTGVNPGLIVAGATNYNNASGMTYNPDKAAANKDGFMLGLHAGTSYRYWQSSDPLTDAWTNVSTGTPDSYWLGDDYISAIAWTGDGASELFYWAQQHNPIINVVVPGVSKTQYLYSSLIPSGYGIGDMSNVLIPEPASMALLALAGLAMIRRRRSA